MNMLWYSYTWYTYYSIVDTKMYSNMSAKALDLLPSSRPCHGSAPPFAPRRTWTVHGEFGVGRGGEGMGVGDGLVLGPVGGALPGRSHDSTGPLVRADVSDHPMVS